MNKKLILLISGSIIIVLIVVGAFFTVNQHTKGTSTTTTTVTQTTSAAAPSDNIYLTKTNASKGTYMTDFAGVTLYTYEKDSNGVSNCSGACLTAWPLYTSGAVNEGTFPQNITVITRSDGSKQFAWKGQPLYYYAQDVKAGDINGDGVEDLWHIVKL